MDRYKKGAELTAWHHGYQAGEFAVARLMPLLDGVQSREGLARRLSKGARGTELSSILKPAGDQ
jgi:hypothetical protein